MADQVYTGGNTTGFASPAGDNLEGRIDLSDVLDLRRPSRYPVRVSGNALTAVHHVLDGDVLICDAAVRPSHGKLAVVMLAGNVLVGQLAWRHGQWLLQSGMPDINPVMVSGADDAEIWAVAVALVRTDI